MAAFVAGGRVALDAIERADYDVMAGPPAVRPGALPVALALTLVRSWRRA